MPNCITCGVKMVTMTHAINSGYCSQCKPVDEEEVRRVAQIEEDEEKAAGITLTTGLTIAGREVIKEIEVVSAECVYGMHIFKDLFVAIRDVFGGRSESMQNTLRDARRTALTELKKEAFLVGADAVVGVDLDYQEITGGGKNSMIMLVASGTAVKLN